MQRKRTRGGYYGDSVELGSNLLPVAQMKKVTMRTLMKYITFAIIVCFVYVVYQKISQASKPTADTDFWPDTKTGGHKKPQQVEGRDETFERRVKEEVNKVFEELKLKQKEQDDRDIKRDVFEDYKIEKKLDDQDRNAAHIREVVKEILNDQGLGGDLKDENVPPAENFENRDDIIRNNNEIDTDIAADDDAKVDIGLFEEDEDPEKEKEELDVEKEIEERLADAFKDAVNEAADEIAEEKVEAQADVAKHGDVKEIEVKLPEVQQIFEKKEFKHAVENMGKGLSPLEVQRMNEKSRREALRHDSDHEFPPFVTAARQNNYVQVQQLVASIQHMMPGRKIYIYDLDLDKTQKKQLMSYCGVKVHYFMKEIFPKYVSDLDKNHWKPLVIQTALAEFGHLIWVNPQYRLGSSEIAPIIHDSHEHGIAVVGQSASYTTFSATHPDMLKFLQTDKEKLSYHPHIEIRAILIHNTPEVHDKVMKVFTACALEESCLAPKGAKWQCKFDFTGRKYADCHRYDESALNILLKNWYNYDTSKYVIRSAVFKPYDNTYRPKMKICRDTNGNRDSEL